MNKRYWQRLQRQHDRDIVSCPAEIQGPQKVIRLQESTHLPTHTLLANLFRDVHT